MNLLACRILFLKRTLHTIERNSDYIPSYLTYLFLFYYAKEFCEDKNICTRSYMLILYVSVIYAALLKVCGN